MNVQEIWEEATKKLFEIPEIHKIEVTFSDGNTLTTQRRSAKVVSEITSRLTPVKGDEEE